MFFPIAAAGCSDGNLGPLTSQGCASAARNPKGPQITPFWHQLGRHPTVLHDIKTRLRRISARISPDRSHPLNLNFFLTIFRPPNCPKIKKCYFWWHILPLQGNSAHLATWVGKNTPLGLAGLLVVPCLGLVWPGPVLPALPATTTGRLRRPAGGGARGGFGGWV